MIYGVGFNKPIEGEKIYRVYENGKNTKCYNAWQGMLQRCYDPKYHAKNPTYIGTECYNEWFNFQVFAKWYHENYYEIKGEKMHLDKDLLSRESKIYSPKSCIFLPKTINEALVCGKGCIFRKKTNKYQARISYKGENIHLGYFTTEEEARYTYQLNKQLIIYLLAQEYKDKLPYEYTIKA